MGLYSSLHDANYFLQVVKCYERLIWRKSHKYVIKGYVEVEDLFQEGLVSLDETLRDSSNAPGTPEFTAEFMANYRSHMYLVMRVHHKTCREESVGDLSNTDVNIDPCAMPTMSHREDTNPEKIVASRNYSVAVNKLLGEVEKYLLDKSSMNSHFVDAYSLLKILSFCSEGDGCVIDYVEMRNTQSFVSSRIVRRLTGWGLARSRYALDVLRKTVLRTALVYGIDLTVS
jgi:hypothetical protein